MAKYKAMLFDYDGTLADTNQIIVNAWNYVGKKYLTGRSFELSDLTQYFGRPLREAVILTCQKYDIHDDIEKIEEVYRGYQREHPEDMEGLFPGLKEALIELKNNGILLGIVTSRGGDSLTPGLESMGVLDLFDALISCDDTDIHKPDPTPCLLCCKKLGIEPSEAIMVGDSRHDISCGNRAGSATCFVNWSFCTKKEDLEGDSIPTFYVDEAKELVDLVK